MAAPCASISITLCKDGLLDGAESPCCHPARHTKPSGMTGRCPPAACQDAMAHTAHHGVGSSCLPDMQCNAGHYTDVDVVRWHPSGHFLGTGSSDRTVRLWDLREGQSRRILAGHKAPVGNPTAPLQSIAAVSLHRPCSACLVHLGALAQWAQAGQRHCWASFAEHRSKPALRRANADPCRQG